MRATTALLAIVPICAAARGVSPYLPLNLEPEMERQVERLLILADVPVLTRPIAAATVLDALPKACKRDAELCESVRRFLSRYTRDSGLTGASLEAAASSGASRAIPNRYGMDENSSWAFSASAFWQPSDFFLASVGAVAYDGGSTPTGSYVSAGFDWAQLDVGYRPHWLSPMTDSSMLLSTQAPTIPSITFSNYRPLTRLGLTYEIFIAQLSTQPIKFNGSYTDDHARLAGFHLAIEPVSGWSLGINRILEFGGAGRPQSLHDLANAFFRPSPSDNVNTQLDQNQEFGNQAAAVTSRFLFPGRTPFAVYFEYSGEDASRGGVYTLGNAGLAGGIDFPNLWKRFDLTYEISEWQNAWYVHDVYRNGLTENGHVLGIWAGDDRAFNNGVGAQSQMLRLGYAPPFGGRFEFRGRILANQNYTAPGFPDYAYRQEREFSAGYSRPWRKFTIGAEATTGRDVFGESFNRVSAFFRYTGIDADAVAGSDYSPPQSLDVDGLERFLVVGFSSYSVQVNADANTPLDDLPAKAASHLALGVRRAVSDSQDLGARVGFDRFEGHQMLSVRALDYRYRFWGPLALDIFVGASTFQLGTPAIGVNFGLGLEWRNVLPRWDVALDAQMIRNAARDRLLASDPAGVRPDIFYSVHAATLSLVRRF